MRHTLSVVVVVLILPTATLAQAAPSPATVNQIVSFNPFGIVLNWANVEFERKVGEAVTVGASASHFPYFEQSNAALLVRWYPERKALEGVYLGARVGAYAFKNYDSYFEFLERTTVMPGAGFEIGRNWLLGPGNQIAIGVGFGLTRIVGGGRAYDVPSVLPAFRLVNVGVAF